MGAFANHTHFAGLDWALDHHDLGVVDSSGKTILQFRFENSAEGWHTFRDKLKSYPDLAIAIETSSGAVVDRLVDSGFSVYPVQPLAAKRYRERKSPSGVKDDQLDAWSLADALRTDGHNWKCLKPDDPLTVELRLLCRDEKGLTEERTAKVNQLRAALHEYYPAALEAFDDWTNRSSWAFIERYPAPEALKNAGKRSWEKFLHTHRLAKPQMYAKRMEIFSSATEFCGSNPMCAAKSLLAVSLSKVLRMLEDQLQVYQKRIQELYDRHPDRDWFGSLPISQEGKTAPRLLSELGDDRHRFEDAGSLQCTAGTAPVRIQTGKQKKGRVRIRRACNKNMRNAIHWFADLSRTRCSWAELYYKQKRKEGHSHASALRCLGQRWLRIIWKMWQDRKSYDPEFHQRNQLKHGSWVLRLNAVN